MTGLEGLTVACAAELPWGHRQAFVWLHSWRRGFGLRVPLAGTRVAKFGELGCRNVARRRAAGKDPGGWIAAQSGAVWHLVGEGAPCSWSEVTRGEAYGDPHLVPRRDQCRRAVAQWPAFLGSGAKHRPAKRRAARAAGGRCSLCAGAPLQVLDHSHLDGLVRGYLCRDCNAHVDGCLHRGGCPCDSYLRNPPLLDLQLQFPGYQVVARRGVYQSRRKAYEEVVAGGISPGVGALWTDASVLREEGWAVPPVLGPPLPRD